MASEEALRPVFEPFGRVVQCSVPREQGTGFSRGFAFVTFAEEGMASAARQALDGAPFEDRTLLVRMKGEPRDAGPRFGGPRFGGGPPGLGARGPPGPRPDDDLPPECKLYVGNLPPDADEAFLHQEFARFGHILSARIITDRDSGRSRGYGFVNYADPEAARGAQQAMNGFTGLEGGRPLIVRSSGVDRKPPPRGMAFRGPPGPPGFGGYYGGPPPPFPGHPPYGPGYGAPPPPYGGAYPPPPPPGGAYGAVPPPPGAYPGGAEAPADPYAAYPGADPYGYGTQYGAVPPPAPDQAGAYHGMYDASGAAVPGPPPADDVPPPPPPPVGGMADDEAPPPPPPPPAPAPAPPAPAAVESEYERFMAEMSSQYN